jgi:hypothetical protein
MISTFAGMFRTIQGAFRILDRILLLISMQYRGLRRKPTVLILKVEEERQCP